VKLKYRRVLASDREVKTEEYREEFLVRGVRMNGYYSIHGPYKLTDERFSAPYDNDPDPGPNQMEY